MYSTTPSAPPPYDASMQMTNAGYPSMSNRHSTSEERMGDFQQLVNRYESRSRAMPINEWTDKLVF